MLRILTRTKGEIEIKETNFLNCDAAQEKKNALTGEVGRWSENLGSTAQFGKSIRPKILPHTKVIKGREYCMYFPLL